MPSNTERKEIGKTWFKGATLVTIVNRQKIFGKEYYDIRMPNGMIRTVPASACSAERK